MPARPRKPVVPRWQDFLDKLGKTGRVTDACKGAGIERRLVLARKAENEDFAQGWADAEARFADSLRAAAWRRGVQGLGAKDASRRRSDRLLERLLAAYCPEFRVRGDTDGTADEEDHARERVAGRIARLVERLQTARDAGEAERD